MTASARAGVLSARRSLGTSTVTSNVVVSLASVSVVALTMYKLQNSFESLTLCASSEVQPLDYTVRISVGSSAGSGFVISEDGFIVTNAHVVKYQARSNVQVVFSDGTKYSGKIHSCDAVSDIALVKIEPNPDAPFRTAKLGDSKSLRAGDAITAIGAPLHLQSTISQGTVCFPLRHEFEINLPTNYEAFIQTDVSTNPGSSGGPLLNKEGEVIGVHSRKHVGGWGLAIPIDRVKEVVVQLKENKTVVRPHYGMDIADQIEARLRTACSSD